MNEEKHAADNQQTTPPTSPLGIVTSDHQPSQPQPKKRLLVIGLVIVAVLLALAVLAGTRPKKATAPVPPVTTPTALGPQVSIAGNAFVPATLKVKAGSTVTWTNQDDYPHWPAANPYPTHSDLPGLNAGKKLNKGDSYSYTFDKTGTYHYHDDLSPIVNGTVIVE